MCHRSGMTSVSRLFHSGLGNSGLGHSGLGNSGLGAGLGDLAA
jgi:hypothetical protein